MDYLTPLQLTLFFLIFIWSGFVRTALGFGGAALSLPLFLFMVPNPVQLIPIIGIHLLLMVTMNLRSDYRQIDWQYLRKTLPWMLPFKIAGVIGLLSLPASVLNIGVYLITGFYALSYITQIRWRFHWKAIDWGLLAAGSYISGTSLIGAPLIIAVFSKYVAPNNLRATLFALWFILVSIKMSAFVITGTDLQLKWALYSLPFTFIGHIWGNNVHQKILTMNKALFMRWIGMGLLLICLIGLVHIVFFSP
ncbi:MAG: TSUP family transporter [Ostreibacterium sp.]